MKRSKLLKQRKPMARRRTKPKATTGIPKNLGLSAEAKGPIRDRQHMARVAQQPCLVCGLTFVQVHHLREALPRTMGVRVGDDMTAPLCTTHHAELHTYNNMRFWERYGIDPVKWAHRFYLETLALRLKGKGPGG